MVWTTILSAGRALVTALGLGELLGWLPFVGGDDGGPSLLLIGLGAAAVLVLVVMLRGE